MEKVLRLAICNGFDSYFLVDFHLSLFFFHLLKINTGYFTFFHLLLYFTVADALVVVVVDVVVVVAVVAAVVTAADDVVAGIGEEPLVH